MAGGVQRQGGRSVACHRVWHACSMLLVQQPACTMPACMRSARAHSGLPTVAVADLAAGLRRAAMQAEAEEGSARLSEDTFEAAMSALELAHFEALNSPLRSAEWQPDGGWVGLSFAL